MWINHSAMGTVYYIGIILALLHLTSGRYNRRPCLIPDAYPQYKGATGCSMFSNDPGVALFTTKLKLLIYSSDILREVFDLSQATPQEYSEYLYKYNLDILTEKGFENAEAIAEFTSRGVLYYEKLTRNLTVRIAQNTASSFLFVEGILNEENAEALALEYADTMENYARAYLTSDVYSKFDILGESFFNFLLRVDDYEATIYSLVPFYFGNAWFEALVNCKWLNQ